MEVKTWRQRRSRQFPRRCWIWKQSTKSWKHSRMTASCTWLERFLLWQRPTQRRRLCAPAREAGLGGAETEGEKEVKKLDQNERRKKYEEIHAKIKSSSNKKILRQQLELLAEHSRICGIDQIPECSEAMVRVAQELNHGIRETILFALLTFGVSFYLLYSLSVKLIKLCRRKWICILIHQIQKSGSFRDRKSVV